MSIWSPNGKWMKGAWITYLLAVCGVFCAWGWRPEIEPVHPTVAYAIIFGPLLLLMILQHLKDSAESEARHAEWDRKRQEQDATWQEQQVKWQERDAKWRRDWQEQDERRRSERQEQEELRRKRQMIQEMQCKLVDLLELP